MAKWDFKIVGASFVKELVPVGDDVQFRSQSLMQPGFDLEGDKIVIKESGAYKSAVLFSQIGEIDGVAPTDIEDAYEKLLTLVENFNGGGGTPGTTPNLTQVLAQSGRLIKEWNSADGDYVFELEDLGKHLYFIGDGVGGDISASIPDDLFPMLKGVELQGSVKYGTNITLVYNESSPKTVTINSNNIDSFVRFNANQTEDNIWSVGLSSVLSIIERGVFTGEFSLNSTVGGEYTPLSQSGALTLSIGSSAVKGGIDSIKITANGSAITVPGSWINVGGEAISTTSGAVNRIMVRQYQNEIWFTCKVN